MTDNTDMIKKALANLHERVKKLETYNENLTSALTGKENKSSEYVDILGNKKFIQKGSSVRIKNAYLIYPNLTMDAANGEYGAGVTLAFDENDTEVLKAIETAFKEAFQRGKDDGKISYKTYEDYIKSKSNQKPFKGDIETIISPNMKEENAKQMRSFGKDKIVTRVYNAMTEREDDKVVGINTVIKDNKGNDVDPKMLRNFQRAEVVLSFSPYKYGSSSGVSQYIQGIKLNQDYEKTLGLWM